MLTCDSAEGQLLRQGSAHDLVDVNAVAESMELFLQVKPVVVGA